MHKCVLYATALAAAFAFPCVGVAQPPAPPKVLQINREFLKPYRGGTEHDKSESAFVAAMAAAHWPTHYLALNSMSGKSRALYLTLYDSFAAWEKDNAAVDKNPSLSAALEKASRADGELLEETDQAVFTLDEELSYKSSDDIGHMRYVEATLFHVKPGHAKEFSDLAKLYAEAHKKAGTSAHWSTWDLAYGGNGDAYLVLSGDKSLAEIDQGFGDEKSLRDAMGEEGRKKARELSASCIESEDSELFAISPKQSYPKDEWVAADPSFWKPKPAAPSAKPVAAKPAQ